MRRGSAFCASGCGAAREPAHRKIRKNLSRAFFLNVIGIPLAGMGLPEGMTGKCSPLNAPIAATRVKTKCAAEN
jgi:hypothetical protein